MTVTAVLKSGVSSRSTNEKDIIEEMRMFPL
jgi:hypothetical protein